MRRHRLPFSHNADLERLMTDFVEYLEKHSGFFGALASILAIIGVIGGWIITFFRRKSQEKTNSQNESNMIAQEEKADTRVNAELPEKGDVAKADAEQYWRENCPAALDCANWYRELLVRFYEEVRVKLGKTMITLYVGGFVRIAIFPRKNGRAIVCVVWKTDDNLAEAVGYFTSEGIAFTTDDKSNNLRLDVNLQQLKQKQAAHEWIAQRLARQFLKTNTNLIESSEDMDVEEVERSLEDPPEKPSGVLAEITNVLEEDGRWEVTFGQAAFVSCRKRGSIGSHCSGEMATRAGGSTFGCIRVMVGSFPAWTWHP
jgi:hypothetical protein